MYNPETKRGVLNDFDLARLGGPNREPSGKDNTGTLPFLALDLLDERASCGLVRRRYRHDAESFTWYLIHICICMKKYDQGKIRTISPHPLPSWYWDLYRCHYSKMTLAGNGFLTEFPLHENIRPLVAELYNHWKTRYNDQLTAEDSASLVSDTTTEDSPSSWSESEEETIQMTRQYNEPSDQISFRRVLRLIFRVRRVIPQSPQEVFLGKVNIVNELYPFVKLRRARNKHKQLADV
jgi:hypothetical protein